MITINEIVDNKEEKYGVISYNILLGFNYLLLLWSFTTLFFLLYANHKYVNHVIIIFSIGILLISIWKYAKVQAEIRNRRRIEQ